MRGGTPPARAGSNEGAGTGTAPALNADPPGNTVAGEGRTADSIGGWDGGVEGGSLTGHLLLPSFLHAFLSAVAEMPSTLAAAPSGIWAKFVSTSKVMSTGPCVVAAPSEQGGKGLVVRALDQERMRTQIHTEFRCEAKVGIEKHRHLLRAEMRKNR
jgi:hypothetical protein